MLMNYVLRSTSAVNLRFYRPNHSAGMGILRAPNFFVAVLLIMILTIFYEKDSKDKEAYWLNLYHYNYHNSKLRLMILSK